MEDLCKEFVPVSDNKCSIKICGTSPRMLELLVKFCRGGNTKQAFLDVKLFLRKLRRYLAKQIDITAGMNLYFSVEIMSMEDFLCGLLSKEIVCPIFPDDFILEKNYYETI